MRFVRSQLAVGALLVGLAFAVSASHGCSSDSGTPGTGGTGGGGTGGGGAGGGGTGGGGTGGTGGSSASVTYVDVKPIFMAKCVPCHVPGGAGATAHTLADSYSSATMQSYSCPGKTKGACTLDRIKNGTMPYMKGCSGDPTMDAAKPECTTAAEQTKLMSWISGGLKEK
jgi:hypothetical protein